MTLITLQDGKPVMRDGKVGTEQECCCGNCQICCCGNEASTGGDQTTSAGCEECYRECVETTYPNPVEPDENGDCQAGYTLVDGYCYQCPEGYTLETSPAIVCKRVTQAPLDCQGCDGECAEGLSGPCGTWQTSADLGCECVDNGCECDYPGPNSECDELIVEEDSALEDVGQRERTVTRQTSIVQVGLRNVNVSNSSWSFLWKTTPAALQCREFFFVHEWSEAIDSEVTGFNPPENWIGPCPCAGYEVINNWTITRERLRFYVVECIDGTQQIRDATGEYVDLFYNDDPYDGSVLETASGYKRDIVEGCDVFNQCPPETSQPNGAEFCSTEFTLDCNPLP